MVKCSAGATPGGRRFVKFDKTSESKARKATAPKPEVKIIYRDRNVAPVAPTNDVRSGRIFERNDRFKKVEQLSLSTQKSNIEARRIECSIELQLAPCR